MTLHKDLTGANLHEPKGVSTASSGQVYVADGAGSGVWTTQSFPSGKFLVQHSLLTSTGTWIPPTGFFAARAILIGGGGGTTANGADTTFAALGRAHGGTKAGVTFGQGGTATSGHVSFAGYDGYSDGTNSYGGNPGVTLGSEYGHGALSGTGTDPGGGGGAADIIWFVDSDVSLTGVSYTIGTGGNSGGQDGVIWIEAYIPA